MRSRVPLLLTSSALATAAFTFLCLLGIGTVLVVGAKLQIAGLGTGASPWAVFEAIAVVALGALGAPVDVGGVRIQVLPLGGIVAVGGGVLAAIGREDAEPPAADDDHPSVVASRRTPLAGAAGPFGLWALLFAVSLAVLCGVTAALSRVRLGHDEVGVAPLFAALAAAGWAVVFALIARLRATRTYERLGEFSRAVLSVVARSLAWFGTLTLAVVITGGILRVATQSPSPPAAGGSMLHGAAFAPNLGIAAGALAMGAPVEAGFGSLAGDGEDRAPTYSLLDWDGGSTPSAAWALLLIPAVSLFVAGRGARRGRTIVPASVVFAAGCGLLAWIGDARVAVEAAERGFARLAPHAPWTFVLALGWALAGLTAGWSSRMWRDRRRQGNRTPTTN